MAMKTLRGAPKRLSGEESVPLSPPHPPRTASPYRALPDRLSAAAHAQRGRDSSNHGNHVHEKQFRRIGKGVTTLFRFDLRVLCSKVRLRVVSRPVVPVSDHPVQPDEVGSVDPAVAVRVVQGEVPPGQKPESRLSGRRARTAGYKKGIVPRLYATGVTVAVQSAVTRAR
jgi:hypothetical protein